MNECEATSLGMSMRDALLCVKHNTTPSGGGSDCTNDPVFWTFTFSILQVAKVADTLATYMLGGLARR